ncbi:TIGR03089 family protein [Dietzia natronolimnaea]|uniref:TIGR03089 family protein n=1 Tax=Dietzia natronolimnaea TaxID=161920 RepID=A0A2A2WQV4_9ACTN|nr:TIGR03089 family protein [Dietzia natronolimnaea]PAY23619.1 TIGR03089 family protein [Dietzia natronolimnaea]
MTTAADTVLQPLLAADPGAPLVTHYDLAAPSRIELSVVSTANWAAKIAGLLRDEVAVAPGDVVVCDLPAHWLTAGVLLGAWWAGAEVRTGPAEDAVAVITTADRLDRQPADVETLLMTTDPMGRPLGAAGVAVPPGVIDLAESCRIHPDAFVPSGRGQFALDGRMVEDLADPTLAGRALVAGRERDDALTVLARVFASGGSAVLVTGSDADAPGVADVATTERTTLTL